MTQRAPLPDRSGTPPTKEQADAFLNWLNDPAQNAMFERIEHSRALERGRVTDAMIERGAEALRRVAAGSPDRRRKAAEAVLRAVLEWDGATSDETQRGTEADDGR